MRHSGWVFIGIINKNQLEEFAFTPVSAAANFCEIMKIVLANVRYKSSVDSTSECSNVQEKPKIIIIRPAITYFIWDDDVSFST